VFIKNQKVNIIVSVCCILSDNNAVNCVESSRFMKYVRPLLLYVAFADYKYEPQIRIIISGGLVMQ
jgi:hypothetical protein